MSDPLKDYHDSAASGRGKSGLGIHEFESRQAHNKKIMSGNSSTSSVSSSASPIVWIFGFIGALFGAGYNISQGGLWVVGAFFGFIAGGFLGGFLSQFKIGRIISWIIGCAFIGGIIYEINFAT
jgi:hypothetical protein